MVAVVEKGRHTRFARLAMNPSTSRMLLDRLGGVFAAGSIIILRRQKRFAWLPTTVIVNASLRTKRIWLRSYYIDDEGRRHDRLIAHRA